MGAYPGVVLHILYHCCVLVFILSILTGSIEIAQEGSEGKSNKKKRLCMLVWSR
jgi:hypothetical protein